MNHVMPCSVLMIILRYKLFTGESSVPKIDVLNLG